MKFETRTDGRRNDRAALEKEEPRGPPQYRLPFGARGRDRRLGPRHRVGACGDSMRRDLAARPRRGSFVVGRECGQGAILRYVDPLYGYRPHPLHDPSVGHGARSVALDPRPQQCGYLVAGIRAAPESGSAWVPLTLDPPATHVEVLHGVAYILAFLAALRVAQRREGAALLSLFVVVTGVILAVAAFLHPVLGAEKVFGIYQPQNWYPPRHIAPLLNANHLAAYVNVAFCLAMGAIADSQRPMPRPLLFVVYCVLGGRKSGLARGLERRA